MKSKKNIYILLPIVLIIWGMLIYQFFSYTSPEVIEVQEELPLFVKIDYKEPDTTALDINHRDPFTGKLENTNRNASSSNVKDANQPKTQILSTPEVQTQIEYKGIVSDVANKKKVFMVIIDNQTFLMKQGEKENEVELINGNRESITIKHKGKKKNILLIE
jgi:hypothetical protein